MQMLNPTRNLFSQTRFNIRVPFIFAYQVRVVLIWDKYRDTTELTTGDFPIETGHQNCLSIISTKLQTIISVRFKERFN